MLYRLFADLTLLMHLAFILFVVLGGILVLRYKYLPWLHLPAVVWAVLIEFMGWVCPLTPLENWLRNQGGLVGYHTSFIEHYILPVLYPTELTRDIQIFLGFLLIAINVGIYGWILIRKR